MRYREVNKKTSIVEFDPLHRDVDTELRYEEHQERVLEWNFSCAIKFENAILTKT